MTLRCAKSKQRGEQPSSVTHIGNDIDRRPSDKLGARRGEIDYHQPISALAGNRAIERLRKLKIGRPELQAVRVIQAIELVSQSNAATLLNVSTASVKRAKTVITKGIPELVEAVEKSAVKVSQAAAIAKLPEPDQERVMTAPAHQASAKSAPKSTSSSKLRVIAGGRDSAIVALIEHLHRDRVGFLSDLAAIIGDEETAFQRLSEYKRRNALQKIIRGLGFVARELQPRSLNGSDAPDYSSIIDATPDHNEVPVQLD